MTEDQQAELLARWLEEGGPPPGGVDDDALEAMFALRPNLAPGPRLSVDDILAGVQTGPLAAPVVGASGGGQAPMPPGASLGAPPEHAPELGSSSRRRPWFLAAFGVAGAGGLAAAALALVVVGGSLMSTGLEPSADRAPVASSPAREMMRPSPRPAVAARPAPMPVQRDALPLDLATRAEEPRERQIAEGLPELAAGRFDAEAEPAKAGSRDRDAGAERDADDALDGALGKQRSAPADSRKDALDDRVAQGPPPPPITSPSPTPTTASSAPPAARAPSAGLSPMIPEVAAPSLADSLAEEEAFAGADEDKARRASDDARAKREQSARKEVESEKKRDEARRRPAAKPAAANTYDPAFDEVRAEPANEVVSLEGAEGAPAPDPAEPVAQPSAPAGSGSSAAGPAPTSAAAHAGTTGASDASITEVRALLLTQGPGAALAAADRHLATHAANTPVRQALLALKGDAHAALGQTALAEAAWRQAIALRDAR